jgi:hypothetical protein
MPESIVVPELRPEVRGHLYHAAELRRRASNAWRMYGSGPRKGWSCRPDGRRDHLIAKAQKHEARARRLEAHWNFLHPGLGLPLNGRDGPA